MIETTGYSPNELIGNNPRVLKSGEMSDAGYKKMYQAISNGQIWSGEFHNRRKNGELYWEHATISPVINDEGEMTHYIAVKEDITQMKMMQEELIENENLYRTIFEAN
ncbi:MAG TPA: PAS domain S-box protein, partial [Bacteroidales bacterium]|nr:PAS domain S-box protein [Bacteroidales bacterium]